MSLKQTDGAVFGLIEKEMDYQKRTLRLIASENYASRAVMEATGSVLTNKYSEGYPKKRYYAGNVYVDEIEVLAIERAKKLFGVGHANVQPHAGASANIAAFFAFLDAGDKFMGLDLANGGHLTHGSPVNFSGKWFKPCAYTVDRTTEALDYDAIMKRAVEEKPKLIICGYTAYPLIIDFKAFREIWRDGITAGHIQESIAEFERGLVTPDSPFDLYLRGESRALSEAARRGWNLFRDLGCVACHQGVNVGGNMYANLGVMGDYFVERGKSITKEDLGRFNVTGREEDRHVFKVPSLRNVEHTGPYFHDGAIADLGKAVDTMARYQLGIELKDEQRRDLVAFLGSLSGTPIGQTP